MSLSKCLVTKQIYGSGGLIPLATIWSKTSASSSTCIVGETFVEPFRMPNYGYLITGGVLSVKFKIRSSVTNPSHHST